MADRYFVETPIAGPRAIVADAEAHHLIHVMRAKQGQTVMLFDGSGAEFAARIERLGRSDVELEIVERLEIDRESRRQVTLAVALPKGDRQRWLVEKLVELGAGRLVPLITARGVAEPGDKAQDRLRRFVIEASKQCGRNRLMQVDPPQDWKAFTQTAGLPFPMGPGPTVANTISTPRPSLHGAVLHGAMLHGAIDPTRIVAHPYTETSAADLIAANQAPLIAAVGPEGGLTDDELESARSAGWQLAHLGPRILRVETAAIALAALASR